MNPRDPVASIKPWIKSGNTMLVETMLEKIDLLKFGGDLLTMACQAGKADVAKLLIKKGANIVSVPDTIAGEENYRRTPMIL